MATTSVPSALTKVFSLQAIFHAHSASVILELSFTSSTQYFSFVMRDIRKNFIMKGTFRRPFFYFCVSIAAESALAGAVTES